MLSYHTIIYREFWWRERLFSLVGIAVVGPFGAFIGGWFGGKKDNVVAAVKFSDERKFLGQFTRRKYRKLAAEYNKRKLKDQFDAA